MASPVALVHASSVPPGDDCAVCLFPLANGSARITLPCSGKDHRFHVQCLSRWAQHNTCPLCRGNLGTAVVEAIAPNHPAPFVADPVRNVRSRVGPTPMVATNAPNDTLPEVAAVAHSLPRMELTFVPTLLVRSAATLEVSGLVSLKVFPPADGVVEKPADVVVLVDVSGSMSGLAEPRSSGATLGLTKMARTKEALAWLVGNLKETDRLALVAFDRSTTRLASLTLGTPEGKARLLAAVESLRPHGGTSIDPALSAAADVLEARADHNPAALVLLLTDGQDSECTGAACERLKRAGAVACTLGVGTDHDARLLNNLTGRVGGTFAYARTADLVSGAVAAASATAATLVGTDVEISMPGVENAITASMLLVGQELYFPAKATFGSGDATLKLVYKGVGGAGKQVLCAPIAVPLGEADKPAGLATLLLVSTHESRVATAEALAESSRLVMCRDVDAAKARVNECVERIRASPAAEEAMCVALLADLERELANLAQRAEGFAYDEALSMQMSAVHEQQTPGELYATPSVTAALNSVMLQL
jgi:hypothetical protein